MRDQLRFFISVVINLQTTVGTVTQRSLAARSYVAGLICSQPHCGGFGGTSVDQQPVKI